MFPLISQSLLRDRVTGESKSLPVICQVPVVLPTLGLLSGVDPSVPINAQSLTMKLAVGSMSPNGPNVPQWTSSQWSSWNVSDRYSCSGANAGFEGVADVDEVAILGVQSAAAVVTATGESSIATTRSRLDQERGPCSFPGSFRLGKSVEVK